MSEKGEKERVVHASKLMLISARTAPKSGGVDDVLTAIIFGVEKELLVEELLKIADERNIDEFR